MTNSYNITAYDSEMVKPKELISIKGSGPLTLQDRRVFNGLLNNAWGKSIINAGEEFAIETTSLREPAQRNKDLKISLRRLMTTLIVATKENGDEVETQLLGSIRISRTGILTYSFPNELAEVLKDSSVFAKLDLEVMKSFSSKYAFALYEAISRRINMSYKYDEFLSVEEMRDLLGVNAGKLSVYRNLRLKAVEPAVTEVNAITPYNVTIQPITKGRKVIKFKMFWSVKSTEEMKESYTTLQRHSLAKHRANMSTPVNPSKVRTSFFGTGPAYPEKQAAKDKED